jgi:ABC-type glycerol-3-phosphate transport system permease component
MRSGLVTRTSTGTSSRDRTPQAAAAGAGGHRRPSRRRVMVSTGKHALLLGYAIAALFPLVLLLSTAVKSLSQVSSNPFGLFTSFTLSNFSTAWTSGFFGNYLLNSVLLTVPSTVLVVVLSTMAGYAFARLEFPFRTPLFYLVMFGLLVPFFAYMIPLYFELHAVGLLNSLVAVDLVLCSTGLAVGTFFMKSFFTDLPAEVEQAARIDGCHEWGIFWRIMLPFVRSGALGLGLYIFVQNWNNFLVPLLLLPSGSYRPVTTGLYQWAGGRTSDYGAVAAGTLIAIIPVVIVFFSTQRQMMRGFAAGAVKG